MINIEQPIDGDGVLAAARFGRGMLFSGMAFSISGNDGEGGHCQ